MTVRKTAYWSPARRAVAATAAVLGSIVWTQALAAVLRRLGPEEAPAAAAALSFAAVATAVAGALALPRRWAPAVAALAGTTAALAVAFAVPGSGLGALALPLVGAAVTWGAGRLGERLPASVDGLPARRRVAAVVWVLFALVAVVQVGRLSAHLVDKETGFVLTTTNPFWHGHECLPAYVHGAEMAARGEENLYDAAHWPALDPAASPETRYAEMTVEDPYQYPPQFLLLPRAAMLLTDHYPTMRSVWLALNVTLFVAAFALLALWVGGAAGRTALWLLPAALSAFPLLHVFQFGQFHLAAVALALVAMVAFARHRDGVGGALLAVAVLAKLFPAVLLLPLVVQKRWRAVAWTAGAGAAFTVLALLVLGPAPFVAFVDYQLPRLADGSAFAFDEAWPEIADLVVVDNQGAFGLARKLGAAKPLAAWVSRLFTLGVLGLAFFVGRRRLGADAARLTRATGWLALVGLASMASPGAWGDYVPVTAIWLAALLAAPAAAAGRRWVVALGLAAAFQYTLAGTMPIGDWAPTAVMLPLATAGLLALLGLFVTTLSVPDAALREEEDLEAVPAPEGVLRAAA
ncbi:MAG TPA: glycosyltransferase family 87 protein [Thermoanaerobaculia bacterium]|nr:glycosyltransferase family 87 protein [Thermoanaerobaculia bacterium]